MIKTSNEELNTALYEKMFAEQEHFKEELLRMEPQAILDRAYEYVIREDFLFSMEYNDLPDKQCEALLKTEKPLADLFEKWEDHEVYHMDEIRDMLSSHANELIREAFKRSREDPR